MIHINEPQSKESSFLLNSQAHPYLHIHDCQGQHKQQVSQSATQIDHDKPLISYLFFSGQSSKVEQKADNSYDPQSRLTGYNHGEKGPMAYHLKVDSRKEQLKDKLKKNKIKSLNERVKTEMNGQFGENEEMSQLRLQNEKLRARLLKFEQSSLGVDSVQGELEYYKKLTYLQQSEIQKLRKLLKQTQSEKLQLFYSQHYQPKIELQTRPPLQHLNQRTNSPILRGFSQHLNSKGTTKSSKQKPKKSIVEKQNSIGGRTLSELTKGRDEVSYEYRKNSTKKNSIAMKAPSKGQEFNSKKSPF